MEASSGRPSSTTSTSEGLPPLPACLCSDGVLAKAFLHYVDQAPRDSFGETRGLIKVHLNPLADVDTTIAAFQLFGTTLTAMAEDSRQAMQRGGEGFHSIFKAKSMEGYDVIRNRKVDYGNKEYKVFALTACLEDVRARTSLEQMCWHFPTVHPAYEDTDDSCNNIGDLVETHLACLRGYWRDWYNIPDWPLVGDEHQRAARCFCDIMRLVQALDAIFCTGNLKYQDVRVRLLSADACQCPLYKQFRQKWREGTCSQKANLLQKLSHLYLYRISAS